MVVVEVVLLVDVDEVDLFQLCNDDRLSFLLLLMLLPMTKKKSSTKPRHQEWFRDLLEENKS